MEDLKPLVISTTASMLDRGAQVCQLQGGLVQRLERENHNLVMGFRLPHPLPFHGILKEEQVV